jgi:hypothetical protein
MNYFRIPNYTRIYPNCKFFTSPNTSQIPNLTMAPTNTYSFLEGGRTKKYSPLKHHYQVLFLSKLEMRSSPVNLYDNSWSSHTGNAAVCLVNITMRTKYSFYTYNNFNCHMNTYKTKLNVAVLQI